MRKVILLLLPFTLSVASFSQGVLPDGSPIGAWYYQPIAQPQGDSFIVTSYGVSHDSTILQTERIQAVIDMASKRGGTVVFPEGTYLTGALFFKSGTHLLLQKGATIKGSDDISHYPVTQTRLEGQTLKYFAALINADHADGFTISGEGTINGNGLRYWRSFWLRREVNPACTNMDEMRPRLVYISNSHDVSLAGVSLVNSAFWTTHIYRCSNVKLVNLTIYSPAEPVKAPSTDALDIDACDNVLVSRCRISVNDDAIALKGGKGPLANLDPTNGPNSCVIVEDCQFGFCHAVLTCGSESIHSSNIIVRHCEVDKADRLLWLKMRPDTPQLYENITVEDIKGNARNLIYIKPWTQFFDLKGTTERPHSFSRNIALRRIALRCDTAFNVEASPSYTLDGFTFEDMLIDATNGSLDRSLFNHLTIKNVQINRIPVPSL